VYIALPSCAGYAFADTLNPTSALHHALANAMLGPLGPLGPLGLPGPANGALFGLGLVGIVLRRGARL